MSKRGHLWLSASLLAIAVPAAAQAQSTTKFDGFYRGVSRILLYDGTLHHSCGPTGGLPPLVISNGSALVAKWRNGPLKGVVDPQGSLKLDDTWSGHFDGQIDGRGVAQGIYNTYAYCRYQVTWQKQP